MSIRHLAQTPSRIRRLGRIARVLAGHGFGHISHRLGLQRYIPFRRFRPIRVAPGLTAAQRVALMMEELGPTFVKLGQVLSTRPDMLPEEYIRELSRLQDHVAPFPANEARSVVEGALGKPIEQLFSHFDDKPMASGSIAQAHLARLPNGEEAVIKIRRPGVERVIRADLDLLFLLAEMAERVEEFRVFRPRMLVAEFSRTILRELDFVTEASNTAKFEAFFSAAPKPSERRYPIKVPKVFWEYTTANVLALERLEGISLSRQDELDRLGVDRKYLARDLADAFVAMYFGHGLFHADPHPGNLLLCSDGSLGILDFGMVGHIDEEMRGLLGTALIALSQRELDVVVEIHAEMGILPESANYAAFKSDMIEILDRYYGIPIRLIDLQRAFADIMRVARAHNVVFPRDLVMLGRSFGIAVGLARQLDPEFDFARVVEPHARGLMRERLSPRRLARGGASMLWQVSNILRRLPRDTRQFSRRLLSGHMQFLLRLPQFDGLFNELDRATNRIAFSIIVSAVIIASSFLIHAKIHPHFTEIPGLGGLSPIIPDLSVLGTLGFLFAGFMGMLLVWAIWRSGKL